MIRSLGVVVAILFLVLGGLRPARAQTGVPTPDSDHQICRLIESAARANGLPIDFFVRLIWQESRFQPNVTGPLTSNGEHAEGIAQFMPGTAFEHRLLAPYDPAEALPKSGELLAELRDQFGNLGLAAAAYNAGPQRVREFLSGSRDLPLETRNYVLAVTGRPVEDWMAPVTQGAKTGTSSKPQSDRAPANCNDVVALLERAPNLRVTEWHGHKIPSWCRGLHHPDVSVCGPVHMLAGPEDNVSPPSHVHLGRVSLH